MEIRCKHFVEYFCLGENTLEPIAEGFITSDFVNTYDVCWDMVMLTENDKSESFWDTDPGL